MSFFIVIFVSVFLKYPIYRKTEVDDRFLSSKCTVRMYTPQNKNAPFTIKKIIKSATVPYSPAKGHTTPVVFEEIPKRSHFSLPKNVSTISQSGKCSDLRKKKFFDYGNGSCVGFSPYFP